MQAEKVVMDEQNDPHYTLLFRLESFNFLGDVNINAHALLGIALIVLFLINFLNKKGSPLHRKLGLITLYSLPLLILSGQAESFYRYVILEQQPHSYISLPVAVITNVGWPFLFVSCLVQSIVVFRGNNWFGRHSRKFLWFDYAALLSFAVVSILWLVLLSRIDFLLASSVNVFWLFFRIHFLRTYKNTYKERLRIHFFNLIVLFCYFVWVALFFVFTHDKPMQGVSTLVTAAMGFGLYKYFSYKYIKP